MYFHLNNTFTLQVNLYLFSLEDSTNGHLKYAHLIQNEAIRGTGKCLKNQIE